jgi:hypothetical protein
MKKWDRFLSELMDEEDEEGEDNMGWIHQPAEASKILELENGFQLFLGNVFDATCLAKGMNSNGIQAVLDVSTEEAYPQHPDIIYMKVPFSDGKEIPENTFAKCMAFLLFCLDKKMPTLVHCAAGISRSPSIVSSFIYYSGISIGNKLESTHLTLDQILDDVTACRSIVGPSPTVFNSCRKWLRTFPYDGTYGRSEPENKLKSKVLVHLLALYTNLDCEVRKSLLDGSYDIRKQVRTCTCPLHV